VITLGIDPSLTGLGWCVHDGGVAGTDRVIAKGTFRTPATRIFYWRFMYQREAISRLLDRYPQVEAVGVESPPFGESYSEGLFGLFLYVNEAIMLHLKDVVYFDPLRVKLLAKMDPEVRQGAMDKSDMVDASRQDTGRIDWTGDEADAYIIARSAARFWDLHAGRITPDELTPAEQHVFRSVHTYVRGKKAGRTIKQGVLYKEGDRFYQFSALRPEELEINISPSEVLDAHQSNDRSRKVRAARKPSASGASLGHRQADRQGEESVQEPLVERKLPSSGRGRRVRT
jgi:hypothetical protein